MSAVSLEQLSTWKKFSPGVALTLVYSISIAFLYIGNLDQVLFFTAILVGPLLVFVISAILTKPIVKYLFEPKIVASYLESVTKAGTTASGDVLRLEGEESDPDATEDRVRIDGELVDDVPDDRLDSIDNDIFYSTINLVSGLIILPTAPIVLGYEAGFVGILQGLLLSIISLGLVMFSYRNISIIIERTPEAVKT